MSKFFLICVEILLVDMFEEVVCGCLFGYFLGFELVVFCFYWLGMDVVLIGDFVFCGFYKDVFEV